MAVDLEAIARRGRCDASTLKIALPLLEQGYSAPFLARYRRDELGGLDESTLWNLKTALDAETSLADFRDKLLESWKSTPLSDPAIGDAIRKSGSKRTLQRLSKRLRQESSPNVATDANRLAVRVLSPQKGDPKEAAELAESIEPITDKSAAIEQLPAALLTRLAGDPRVISAAVRWLSKNAKIHISNVHDPHLAAAEEAAKAADEAGDSKPTGQASEPAPTAEPTVTEPAAGVDAAGVDAAETEQAPSTSESTATDASTDALVEAGETPAEQSSVAAESAPQTESEAALSETPASATPTEQVDSTGVMDAADSAETPIVESSVGETESTDPAAASDTNEALADPKSADAPQGDGTSGGAEDSLPQFQPDPEAKVEKKAEKKPAPKKQKKVSPRQRRRRWLVNVLKPLEGKRMPATKLSAFQVVMLGRALRSQVAVCAFEYDAAKLVAEIKRVAIGLNRSFEGTLSDIVMQHEADIREAGEAAWWDELHERASARLVSVAADHLRDQVNRGPVGSASRDGD